MKNIFYYNVILALLSSVPSFSQSHQDHATVSDTVKGSPKKMVMTNIGDTHVHIEYSSPAVRKRVIWGGLVAYDAVWVTGAHQATSVSFSSDVTIAGSKITKGKYGFFTIPGEKEWTLILNKNWKQHLADDYSQKDDVLRWKVIPQPNEHTERLTYKVSQVNRTSGNVEMLWEKVKISFGISSVK